jgi:cytochrome d ubiquinol oxidase subunit II
VHLYEIPIICVLIGLALYAVLGGADFGGGLWQLTTLVMPRGSVQDRERADAIREQAHHSMGPVWEANHVWLIFALTVTWTAYPVAFAAIASTLAVPLLIAGVGIVFRGAAYALRAGSRGPREKTLIDTIFSIASLLTPFALGTIIGALVLRRVPVGNAAGGVLSSWTAPLSLLLGALNVLVCAYIAAVYLAADADREAKPELRDAFRTRALGSGMCAGVLALALLPVLHADQHHVYTRLLTGPGLIGVAISVLAGAMTIALVIAHRFEAARLSAALAVTGLIIGWALAQQPIFLAHLTIRQAAAPSTTLIALLAAIAMGVVILFPSLGLLFRLQLGGRFTAADANASTTSSPPLSAVLHPSRHHIKARVAAAGLIGGVGFLNAANPPWAHIIGVICLAACAVFALLALDPIRLAANDAPDDDPHAPPLG